MKVEVGSLIVQFAGKCMTYHDATEWNVTHAILSNSLAVSSAETRLKRNEQVDAVMHEHGLVHIGWLRQASKMCPLSSLDLDTQRVYEKHLPDAFAALLDLSPGAQEPVVYFYCLVKAAHSNSSSDAFVAAHHVVLDSSVPYTVIEVSLPDLGKASSPADEQQQQCQQQEGSATQVMQPMRQLQMKDCVTNCQQQQQQEQTSGLPSRQSDETDNTDVAVTCFSAEELPLQAVSTDDVMSMNIL